MELRKMEIAGLKFNEQERNEIIATIRSKGFAHIETIMKAFRDDDCVEGMMTSVPPEGSTLTEYLLVSSGMLRGFAVFLMLRATIEEEHHQILEAELEKKS